MTGIMTPVPLSVQIFRRLEKGADPVSILGRIEAREVDRIRNQFCTPVPADGPRWYRHVIRDGKQAKRERLRIEREAEIEAFRQKRAQHRRELDRHWNAVLADPKSSVEDRCLARVELGQAGAAS
jgi:hypothetical protein